MSLPTVPVRLSVPGVNSKGDRLGLDGDDHGVGGGGAHAIGDGQLEHSGAVQ